PSPRRPRVSRGLPRRPRLPRLLRTLAFNAQARAGPLPTIFFPCAGSSFTLGVTMVKHLVTLFLLCGSLSALATPPSEHWFEVTSPHFIVLTESNEKQARSLT